MSAPAPPLIRTPDQRLRVFVSSTLGELAPERAVVREAVEGLRLTPVMFELGARPHPPRELYRAYLEQSHVFVGLYGARYGWVAPGEDISGLEDEYRLAGERPRLLYLKEVPEREDRLERLLVDFQDDDRASYKRFSSLDELGRLVADDLALLLSERFESATGAGTIRPPSPATAVPEPLTPTVGREADLDAVTAALAEGHRLVTLTGPGGVGKSRLAVEVGRRAAADGAEVHLVSLATSTDADQALHAVADRLAVSSGAAGPVEALVAHLRGGARLLVLDNVEQILDIGPTLVALLERLPELTVLVTSRRALRVGGEWEHTVAPLPAGPAVDLFAGRARAVAPRFRLDPASRPAVEEVVHLLDGLPLAIELAAAQMRVLSAVDLRDRLVTSFDVLASRAPDLPERQRTLRATLDWSHALLTAPEQALFAWLSTFDGGWTLGAAEAVVPPDGPDVVETLAALLDKSLIVTDQEEAVGSPRFAMLRTVQRYAAERLAERGEVEVARDRHLAWARALSDEAKPGLCGPGQQDWVARMAPERPNLRRAVATAFDRGDHAMVVELAWDVVVLYFLRDAVDEPDEWLRRASEAEPDLDEATDAKLRSLFALTRIHHGDYAGAPEALTTALAVFRRHGMDFESAVVLHQLGFVAFRLEDDVATAVRRLEESSSLFAGIGHEWGVGLAEAMLGSILTAGGDLDGAEAHQRRSLEHARGIASDQQVVQALGQLALIRLLQERYDEARGIIEESAPTLRANGFRVDTANALDVLALVADAGGDHERAAVTAAVATAERARLLVEPWPTLQPFIDRVRRRLQETLGPDRFAEVTERAAGEELFATLDATLAALSR